DGHPDLLFATDALFPGAPLRMLLGSADGVFAPAAAGALPSLPAPAAALIAVDVDGDRDLDLFVATRDHRPDLLLRNDGSGRFLDVSAMQLPGGTTDARAAACADFDGDGDLDVAVACVLGPDRLLVNDGTGRLTLGPALPDLPGDEPSAMVAADLDGDGRPELFVANALGRNRLWRNLGGGRFVDVTSLALPTDGDLTTAAVAADVDGDGALDLVTGNATTPLRLYRNDGRGRFRIDPRLQACAEGATSSLLAFDADADGDVDLVVGRVGVPDELW